MPFDITAADAIGQHAVQLFSEGLQGLLRAAAEEADAERRRAVAQGKSELAGARAELEQEYAQLSRERADLEALRSKLEASKAGKACPPEAAPASELREACPWPAPSDAEGTSGAFGAWPPPSPDEPGSFGGWPPDAGALDPKACASEAPAADTVLLNIGGRAFQAVSRSALTQCRDSILAAQLDSLPRDAEGRVVIDARPEVFVPLVQHLIARHCETSAGVEASPAPDLGDLGLDRQFSALLQRLGLQDWVLRRETVRATLSVRGGIYAVLPSRHPSEATSWAEMGGQIVTVPYGWAPLSIEDEEFEATIEELTAHGWGASVLFARSPSGSEAGFHKFFTQICPEDAEARQRVAANARLFEVQSPGALQFRFAGAASGRLLIRKLQL